MNAQIHKISEHNQLNLKNNLNKVMNKTAKLRFPFFIFTELLLVILSSCINTALLPVVESKELTAITATTATCWGNVPVDAGSAVTARGACWSTKPNPTTSNTKSTATAGTGEFSTAITGLTAGTTYYIRCYATNSTGTAYGSQLTFKTLYADNDGNVINTITIGTQTWMAENLKSTKFQNGNIIANVTDPSAWRTLTTASYSSYNNNSAYLKSYGNLYNWFAVNDTRNIAPKGWHVPTQAEWTTLINYLGGISVAGDKLKETGNVNWIGIYSGATNSSGFNALPGGILSTNSFTNIGITGQWWSATEVDTNTAWNLSLSNASPLVVYENNSKQNGLSIRCILN